MRRFLYSSIFKTVTSLLLIAMLFVPCVSVVGVTRRGSKRGSYRSDMGKKLFQVLSVEDAEDWDGSEYYDYVRLSNLNQRLELGIFRDEGLGRDDLEYLSLYQIFTQMREEKERLEDLFKEIKEAQDQIDDLDISDDDKDALKDMVSASVSYNDSVTHGSFYITVFGIVVGLALAWNLIEGIVCTIMAILGLADGLQITTQLKFRAYMKKETRKCFFEPAWIMVMLILYLSCYGWAMQGMYKSAMWNSKLVSMYTGFEGYRVLVEPFLNPFVWLAVTLAVGILMYNLVKRITQDD